MSRSRRQRDKSMTVFHGLTAEGEHITTHIGNDFTDGNRGMSHAVAGAKKFINSRRRFRDKAALQRNLAEGQYDTERN